MSQLLGRDSKPAAPAGPARQRKVTAEPAVEVVPPVVRAVLSSPGQPLDADTRAFFEPRFGHDFGRVRVHADGQAARSASAVGALAYAVGPHIGFGAGQFAPRSLAGRQLLAHELAHVVQQRDSALADFGLRVLGSHPAERDADQAASAVMTAGPVPRLARQPAGISRAEPGVYRSASTEVIDIEGSVAAVERWQQGLADSVAESNIVAKVLAFVPFFFLELLRRAVQLGNLLFGVTALQQSADVIFNPVKSLGARIKAGLWAMVTVAMSLLMIGGVSAKVGQWVGHALKAGSRIGWIQVLRMRATAFINETLELARHDMPTLVTSLVSFARFGRSLFTRLVNRVTSSEIWAKMLQWARRRVLLPRFLEALSNDVGDTLHGLLRRETEKLAPPMQNIGQAADEMSWSIRPPSDRPAAQSRTIPLEESSASAEIVPTRHAPVGDVPVTRMEGLGPIPRFTGGGKAVKRMRGLTPTAYPAPKRLKTKKMAIMPTVHKPVGRVGGRTVTREEQFAGVPSREDWDKIRRGTPTDAHRARARQELPLGSLDPAFPGRTTARAAQPDHMIPVDVIRKMPGYAYLEEQAQMIVLNMEENFVALSARANQSKGGRSFSAWIASRRGLAREVDPGFAQEMIAREAALPDLIQQRINELLQRQMTAAAPSPGGALRLAGPAIKADVEHG